MADQFVELLGTAPVSVDGGKLTFVRGSLCTTLSIWKDRYNRSGFGWMVYTDYIDLRDRMDGFGGVGIRIDHPPPSGSGDPSDIPPAACYLWPAGSVPLSAEIAGGVTRYGPSSLRFVRDSHDLGLLLLADTHIHRDGVWSFTPANNEPGRWRRPSFWLVSAVIRIWSGRLSPSCETAVRNRCPVTPTTSSGNPSPTGPGSTPRPPASISVTWPSSSGSAPSTPRSRSSTRLSRPGR
ncbi:hypothetical protein [Streptomyces sp. CC53]|uniref:hypothetical protein n=1 Tax=Streptomyces sp. CC53 TaxID=1906740 RepID=UPI00115F8AEA|nr:hypothetical protein [Streptomyces sp. CC53]